MDGPLEWCHFWWNNFGNFCPITSNMGKLFEHIKYLYRTLCSYACLRTAPPGIREMSDKREDIKALSGEFCFRALVKQQSKSTRNIATNSAWNLLL